MTISAAPWRARRLPGAPAAARGPGEAAPSSDAVGSSPRQQRRYARAERAGSAASARDGFMDAVVLLSVVVFVALAAGAGALVLQAALRH